MVFHCPLGSRPKEDYYHHQEDTPSAAGFREELEATLKTFCGERELLEAQTWWHFISVFAGIGVPS